MKISLPVKYVTVIIFFSRGNASYTPLHNKEVHFRHIHARLPSRYGREKRTDGDGIVKYVFGNRNYTGVAIM